MPDMLEPDISTDGTTVWVNTDRCLGRFCKFSAEIMMYDSELARDAVVTVTGPSETTSTKEWLWFVDTMKRLHGAVIDDSYAPRFLRGSVIE